jgi:hypothetical protein
MIPFSPVVEEYWKMVQVEADKNGGRSSQNEPFHHFNPQPFTATTYNIITFKAIQHSIALLFILRIYKLLWVLIRLKYDRAYETEKLLNPIN